MRFQRSRILYGPLIFCFALLVQLVDTATAGEVNPTVAKALALVPTQSGIDYDQPSQAEAAECKLEQIKDPKTARVVGWLVTSPDGTTLRRFVNTNGDSLVDRWSYYKDGLEVFRDVDTDFDGKADQCRWFNTAGCRWGTGVDASGQIGSWKAITPEEVSSEAVAALATKDWPRMQRLLLTSKEAESLGLGEEKQTELTRKLATLQRAFDAAVQSKNAVAADAKWVQFSGGMPGIVPLETDDLTKDVTVYENAAAIVQSESEHGEVLLGTLVRVGDTWRMIDIPRPASDSQTSVASGFFFVPSAAARPKVGAAGPSEAAQALLTQLEQLDQALQGTTDTKKQAGLHARRSDLLEQVAETADTPQNRVMWYHQLADMANAAIQSGSYPDGAKRLGELYEKLAKDPKDKDLAAYVRFRQIMADYGLSLTDPKADYQKIQRTLVENLEKFVEQYPKTSETPEAMLQMAITLEFTGEEDEAKEWHGRIVQLAPESPVAKKSRGARTRLDSVGKRIEISGTTATGKAVDVDDYRGKAVLVQYWATWCDPAKADLPALKELVSKYRGQFSVIGVSLDNQLSDLNAYLKENPLPWPQIFEQGGLDSRPANQMGILTVPTMILIDKDGKVVSRNVSVAELDKELKTMLR